MHFIKDAYNIFGISTVLCKLKRTAAGNSLLTNSLPFRIMNLADPNLPTLNDPSFSYPDRIHIPSLVVQFLFQKPVLETV